MKQKKKKESKRKRTRKWQAFRIVNKVKECKKTKKRYDVDITAIMKLCVQIEILVVECSIEQIKDYYQQHSAGIDREAGSAGRR